MSHSVSYKENQMSGTGLNLKLEREEKVIK